MQYIKNKSNSKSKLKTLSFIHFFMITISLGISLLFLLPSAESQNLRTSSRWIPSVWKEYIKYGPVKNYLPDFSHAGYEMGNKEIPTEVPTTNAEISDNKHIELNTKKITLTIEQTKIPIFDITSSQFGAVPDDDIDDTAAIQSAIDAAAEAGGGVVFLPKGKYEVHKRAEDKFIQIRHDNIIIKGCSREETILNFNSPSTNKKDRIYRLGTVPAEHEGRHKTTLAVIGSESFKELTRYTKTVLRGEKEIHVMDSSELKAGQIVIIEFDDPLIDSKNPSPDKADIAAQLTYPLKLVKNQTDTFGKAAKKIRWIVRIDKIIDKNRVKLSEPARFNHYLRYSPRILSFNGIKEVGIENLTIQSNWQGGYRHHKPFVDQNGKIIRTAKEQDYLWGGLWLSSVYDAWIKNVKFKNLTQGIIFSRCAYITAKELLFEGIDGHAGITIAQSHGILIERADFFARLVHPVTLKNFASGNVITDCNTYYDGRDNNNSTDAVIDFHGLFPYENLFDNMKGFYICPGGDTSVMPHAGVRNVFWNIEAPKNMTCYTCELKDDFMRTYDYTNTSSGTPKTMYEYQPQGFFIGITRKDNKQVTMAGSVLDRKDIWLTVEGLNRQIVEIPSLYKAQFDKRFNSNN